MHLKTVLGSLEEVSGSLPLPKQVKIPDPVTGKEIMQDVFTGKTNMKVSIEPMNPDKVKALGKKFIKEYKATAPQVRNLFNTLTSGREKFAEQLTAIGRRLDPDSFVKFREAVEESLTNVVDRGYQVFKNNKNQFTTAVNYPPTKQLLKKTMNYYKKVAKQKGYNVGNEAGQIGDDVFERLVRQTWRKLHKTEVLLQHQQLDQAQLNWSVPKFFKASVSR